MLRVAGLTFTIEIRRPAPATLGASAHRNTLIHNCEFTYDFDGDGVVDSMGHCRAEHVYANPNSGRSCVTARACVSDRRPDGEVCRSYDVCLEGEAVLTDMPPTEDDDDDPEPEPTEAE